MSASSEILVIVHIPFVHMGFRYGGPILNTAATSIYWKQDTRNSTEFSKFLASNLSPSWSVSVGGGSYLRTVRKERRKPCACTYHDCDRTQKYAQNWKAPVISTWPMMLHRTFLETRLAVGPFGKIRGYGRVRPTREILRSSTPGIESTTYW